MSEYKHVVIGGTFDGLHKGHTYLLTRAFTDGKYVTIGLTSDAYIRRFKPHLGVTPFRERLHALEAWIRREGYETRATIVALDNVYGPAILGEFDGIIVTRDNRKVAEDINTVRHERGLTPLTIIEVPMVPAEDHAPISSTRMREGIIDANGHLLMPDALRPHLQKPLGTVFSDTESTKIISSLHDKVVISVGDVTTKKVLDSGIVPKLAIIDLIARRKPFGPLESFQFPKDSIFLHIKSGPGYIAKEAINAVKDWGRPRPGRGDEKTTVIVVDGEEDLLTLPAIAFAPLGSVVLYGQPPPGFGSKRESGLVEVVVTQEKKHEAIVLLSQFRVQ